ncbi:restriction endonuclease subunit S [Microtetraspora niveoalba]|uniref:restriction endonuclease subunit S n=1 Tax=Microtetraspora niveoalba TaxID=46175 RepID=UPI000AA6D89B|nr:restriction endonuclease subunit S [Microtetraspora niveoalba]
MPAHWAVAPGHSGLQLRREKNIGLKEGTVLSLSYGRIIVKPQEKLRGLIPDSFETYQIADPGNIIIRPTDLQNDKTSLRVGLVRNRGIITSAYLCIQARPALLPEYAYELLRAYDLLKIFYGMGSGLRQNLEFGELKRMPIILPPIEEQHAIVSYLGYVSRQVNAAIRAKLNFIDLLREQKRAIVHQAVTRGLNPSVPLKESGIPGVDAIPQHWEVMRVKQVCERIVDCKNRTPDLVPDGDYTVVRTTNVRGGEFSKIGSYPTDLKNYVEWTRRGAPQIGDVFFTREAPAGEACLVPDIPGLCMGQRMMYFRPRRDLLDSGFLLHSIYGPVARTYINLTTNGSTVGHLRLGQVSSLPLLWCPREEQVEIVEHIDRASQPLNAAISRAEREIALLREYRTRLTADVVTGKVDVRAAAALLPNDAELFGADEALEDIEDLALEDEAEE